MKLYVFEYNPPHEWVLDVGVAIAATEDDARRQLEVALLEKHGDNQYTRAYLADLLSVAPRVYPLDAPMADTWHYDG